MLLLNFSYVHKDAVTLAVELMLETEKIGDVTENSVAFEKTRSAGWENEHCPITQAIEVHTAFLRRKTGA